MNFFQKQNHPAMLLASLVSGLLLTPVVYIAIGALGAFSAQLSYFVLPVFILSAGYLFWSLFASSERGESSRWTILLESLCWLVVILFLMVISGFRLFTMGERIGFACSIFLVTTMISYPVVYLRSSVLLSRMEKLPRSNSMVFAVVVILSAVISSGYYIIRPSGFL